MSVTDLHPEDLLDREARGELTDKERAHLDAHLAQCSACRLERVVRADFAAELDGDESPSGALLVSKVLAGTAAAPKAPDSTPSLPPPPAEQPEVVVIPTRRRRPRVAVLLVAAAALTLASAAVAARGTAVLGVFFPETNATHSPATSSNAEGLGGAPATTAKPAPRALNGASESVETVESSEVVATAPTVAASHDTPPPAPLTAATAPVTIQRAEAPIARATATTEPPAPPVPQVGAAPTFDDAGALFAAAGEARRGGDHARAGSLYRELLARFPGASEAPGARIALGRMLLDDGDAAGALAQFDAYLAMGGPLAEEAMAGRARALGRLGRSADERAAWSALLRTRPQSIHADRARARLEELDRR